MKLSIIVAMAENRVIGLNNQMPWHLSADLKRFKQITLGYPILMGRKTFESIGKPLPGRTNIIVSRNSEYQKKFQHGDCILVQSIEAAIEAGCRLSDEIFVIGGSTLYQATLKLADTLYITQIQKDFQGDTFFPEFYPQGWLEVEHEHVTDDTAVDFAYSFLKMEKIAKTTD